MNAIITYFRESWDELKRVNWPTRDEVIQGTQSVALIERQDHLDVGVAVEQIGTGLLAAEVLEIVNLAVAHEVQAAVGRGHRLAALVGQVDDAEPPLAERHAGPQPRAFAVGAAMR